VLQKARVRESVVWSAVDMECVRRLDWQLPASAREASMEDCAPSPSSASHRSPGTKGGSVSCRLCSVTTCTKIARPTSTLLARNGARSMARVALGECVPQSARVLELQNVLTTEPAMGRDTARARKAGEESIVLRRCLVSQPPVAPVSCPSRSIKKSSSIVLCFPHHLWHLAVKTQLRAACLNMGGAVWPQEM